MFGRAATDSEVEDVEASLDWRGLGSEVDAAGLSAADGYYERVEMDDDSTCDYCQEIDGMLFDPDDVEALDDNAIPHYGCRGSYMWVPADDPSAADGATYREPDEALQELRSFGYSRWPPSDDMLDAIGSALEGRTVEEQDAALEAMGIDPEEARGLTMADALALGSGALALWGWLAGDDNAEEDALEAELDAYADEAQSALPDLWDGLLTEVTDPALLGDVGEDAPRPLRAALLARLEGAYPEADESDLSDLVREFLNGAGATLTLDAYRLWRAHSEIPLDGAEPTP
jgi:hypothetical protein